jgi:transcription elongation factor GreB
LSKALCLADEMTGDNLGPMSKAFTREENEGPDLPDLPPLSSTLPSGAKNYITRGGADRLREELERLIQEERPALAGAADDPEAQRRLSILDQKVFQLEQSLQSAEVVEPGSGPIDSVRFGASVTVRENEGEETTYRIVGVDEIDLDRGWVSWLSPIARALMKAKLGQHVRFKFPSGEKSLEIVRIAHGN